jgi:hypothetical protein
MLESSDSYTGATILQAGTLEVAALDAAGIGKITFDGVASDHHGGTDVTLQHPLGAGIAASLFSHGVSGENWTSDAVGNGDHVSDYLFVA